MPTKRDKDDNPHHPPLLRSPGHPVDPLVTVETQREQDLFSGEAAERTFVKLYVAARESGLLAAISDRDWKTLCTLATYMDGDGYCFPSQAELAKAIGCSRQMANERVKSLAAFRFRGQQVLLVAKGERSGKGEWSKNGYRVLPISRLRIYDADDPPELTDSGNDSAVGTGSTVSSSLDTVAKNTATVSSRTVTVGLDTNKNHILEQDFDHSKIRKAQPKHSGEGRRTDGAARAAVTAGDEPKSSDGGIPQESTPKTGLDDPGAKFGYIGGSAPQLPTGAAETVPLGEAIERWRQRAGQDGASSPGRGTVEANSGHKTKAAGIERVGATLERRRDRLRRVPAQDEAYQAIQAYVADFAKELSDRAPLKSATTRAYNLYKRSGLELAAFINQLYAARAIVKERTGSIRTRGETTPAGLLVKHKAGYYFAVLEDLLGLRPEDVGPASVGADERREQAPEPL